MMLYLTSKFQCQKIIYLQLRLRVKKGLDWVRIGCMGSWSFLEVRNPAGRVYSHTLPQSFCPFSIFPFPHFSFIFTLLITPFSHISFSFTTTTHFSFSLFNSPLKVAETFGGWIKSSKENTKCVCVTIRKLYESEKKRKRLLGSFIFWGECCLARGRFLLDLMQICGHGL